VSMNRIVKLIGSVILASLLFGVPVLTTMAFFNEWRLAWFLAVVSFAEFSLLSAAILHETDDGEQ